MGIIKNKIAVIGLGYVGLPLAYAFAEKYKVFGFDVSETRIKELNGGLDRTSELSETQIKQALENNIVFSSRLEDIAEADVYIVTVPTPIDKNKNPDISYLEKASKSVASVLNKGNIVIYESTVYPGCTEEDCVPIIEKESGLKYNEDFYCGYSPERINPGDKVHTVTKILKVTSGSTPQVAKKIDELYASIITAGTYLASSIKVAEASKIIENTQRDINISLVNELALIFDRMEIDTLEVLEAAGTKWNFLPFRPGLVGGHCIGVDPFYLTHKAESLGYKPHVIHSGRSINDEMGIYIANKVIKLMVKNDLKIKNSKILVLGMTFKENCPDIRNSRVIDVIEELESFGSEVSVYDPCADKAEVSKEYNISLIESLGQKIYDAIILTVSHDEFKILNLDDLKSSDKTVVYDVKSFLPKNKITDRL